MEVMASFSQRLAAVAAALTCLVLPSTPASAADPSGSGGARAAASVTTVGPGTPRELQTAFQALRAGDTLRLLPGRYDIGGLQPLLAKGTPSARIVVTAADPRSLPELRGHLVLRDADHWLVNKLRLVATVKGEPALKMAGGHGWTVANSEMTGAAGTGDYANVAIDADRSTGVPPTGWTFTGNCVHHAAPRPAGDSAGYHNVYVNAEGGGGGSLFARNVLFAAPGGSNLKIGAGGDPRVQGPAGIRVENNTMYDANQQVLVFGKVDGIMIRKNLLVRARGGSSVNTGQYLHSITADGRTRVLSRDNYGYLLAGRPTFVLSSPARSYTAAGNTEAADPRFAVGCGRFVPTAAAARAYGRYGTAP